MIKRPQSDEELIARTRRELSARKKRRAIWVLVIGFALLFGAIAALSLTGHAALVFSLWGQIVTAGLAGALFVYFFAMLMKYFVSPDADSRGVVRRRIDTYQRRWRWTILLMVCSMLPGFAFLPTMFWVFGAHPFMRTLLCAVFALLTILLVYMLSEGPGFAHPGASELINDEFVSALRARMMRFAYILTMLLFGGVLFIALWQPSLTLTALSWALYAGFAVPALYYVIADWRASGKDQERDG